MKPIVEVDNLSKRYRIAHSQPHPVGRQQLGGAARETLAGRLRDPLRRGRGEWEELWALDGLSFAVAPGEIVGIIGRNGCGKSTLLKILSRIVTPTGGTAVLRGRVASLLEVGTGFHAELTGRENILLNGALLGMPRRETRLKFDAIVEFAGIERFLDTPVKFYSSGMYVRLGFSIAAHLEPDVLIVDEVLSVGDAEFQRRSLGKMEQVTREEGRTVLFVSHTMSAVENLCTRTILLDAGKLVFDGAPREAVQTYLGSAERAVVKLAAPAQPERQKLWFTQIALEDDAGAPRTDFDAGERVQIALEYEARLALRDVQLSIELWNDEGECILCTTSLDEDPAERTALTEAGRYVASCAFETGMLRRGGYHLTIAATIPGIESLDERQHAAHFTILADPNDIQRLGQGRRGTVYSRLHWDVRAARPAATSDPARAGR